MDNEVILKIETEILKNAKLVSIKGKETHLAR